MHTGAAHHAKLLALRNLDAFGSGLDAIIATSAAGCSSAMKEYGLLFRTKAGDRMGAAEAFSSRVVDISVFLESLGLVRNPPPSASVIRVAYHDPRHLAHAQGVRTAPRALLGAIENVTVVEPADWQLCCGSAGTYNVDKPEIAGELGQRKARSLLATGADVIVTGNVGCIVQLRHTSGRSGIAFQSCTLSNFSTRHTVSNERTHRPLLGLDDRSRISRLAPDAVEFLRSCTAGSVRPLRAPGRTATYSRSPPRRRNT